MPKKKNVNAKNQGQRKLAAGMRKSASGMRKSAKGMVKTSRREDVNQAAAPVVRDATREK